MSKTLLLVSSFACLVSSLTAADGRYPTAATARALPIETAAYAGSSVNVVGGLRQAVFTDSVHQYAGFYDETGELILAKRRLGEDSWTTRRTGLHGAVHNAHNSISLAVDGAGFLHVAWDHHNRPLRYARGTQPGTLELGPEEPMLDRDEDRVTYPHFVPLPQGDLLFLYRAGGSGDGRTVLNRYVSEAGEWRRMHDSLLDGEGERSPYWDLAIDGNGVLHLAWNWRVSPDVSTNHDLAYARSEDGGWNWQRTDGSGYTLPITADSAEYAVRIPQGSNLMNPPTVTGDRHGRPFLSSYWSPEKSARPRFHLVYFEDGSWKVLPGPKASKRFSLKGSGTKAPPWSRAALMVESLWDGRWAHLIYRDDARGGRVFAATASGFPDATWSERVLVDADTGSWEPSVDPILLRRLRQAHLLLQEVKQIDGDDLQGAEVPPTPIDLLVWSPDWERHQAQAYPTKAVVAEDLDRPIEAEQVRAIGLQAARWQWDSLEKNGSNHHLRGWVWAPFYIGNLAFAEVVGDEALVERMRAQAESIYWKPHHRMYDADDHCVIQAYAALYQKYGDEKMLRPSKERFDAILARPSPATLDWGSPNVSDRWSWCDALFMAPPSWLMLWEATGDQRYLDFMNQEWWATTERLYHPEVGLYFRDESYLDVREPNGKTVHWARGNGWVIAGLARVLERFPKDHADYPRYESLFRELSAAFLDSQQADGLWRPGLLDPEAHPARETSGSSFITFGLAWGLNHGLLDESVYGPVVGRAWHALSDSVTSDGRLEHVQPIGAAPHGFDPRHSEPFAVGAFLLAASEVLRRGE